MSVIEATKSIKHENHYNDCKVPNSIPKFASIPSIDTFVVQLIHEPIINYTVEAAIINSLPNRVHIIHQFSYQWMLFMQKGSSSKLGSTLKAYKHNFL